MDKEIIVDVMLSTTSEPIVVIDKNGYIVELSSAYAEFLKTERKKAIGKHVTEVIENTRMHIVLKTGKEEIAEFQEINGKTMIATRIPIIRNGKILGAYGRVLFKDFQEVYSLYGKMCRMEEKLSMYERKYGDINAAKYDIQSIIGKSKSIIKMKENLMKIAPGNSNVLITGESGTGKELVAHAVHSASKRRDEQLICVNCAAIPSQLMESELFGYEEGAFTGARKKGKQGLFQAAHRGTLFLDEIGDLPINMQVKILRAIQEGEIRKVGASVGKKIDVRIVAATNKNLDEMVEQGEFRKDLFYRLNVVNIDIPPIRQRKEDIPVLVKFFVKKLSEQHGMPINKISSGAMEYLKQYDWPGNIRELENTLERASNFVGDDGIIRPKHLQKKELTTSLKNRTLKEIMEETERGGLINALIKCDRCKTKAARSLGISRTTLYEKLEKYQIDMR